MTQKVISIGKISVGNSLPFVLFGGMNVLESRDMALRIAAHFKQVTMDLQIPWVFKASFDKANRSSLEGFRGPGLEQGLLWLEEIKRQFDVPIITDVHEPFQAKLAAEVADVIQLPAFLSRQTDLVKAMAETGAVINIKKAQFLTAQEMGHILHKFEALGNDRLMLCERGTMFGYNNLVVDMLNFPLMKQFEYPVMFDVTHALQLPGGLKNAAGGRGEWTLDLARAGMSQGLAGLYCEAHPDPRQARCDGPSALPLSALSNLLQALKKLDALVKEQTPVERSAISV